jgi:hypothetical protein
MIRFSLSAISANWPSPGKSPGVIGGSSSLDAFWTPAVIEWKNKSLECHNNDMSVKRQQHLFIVRLWAESTTVPSAEDWHGLVQHVSTGQKFYFTTLDDLTHFIEAQRAGGDRLESSCKKTKAATPE